MKKGLFTSNKDDWETPQNLFDELNAEFDFEVDVCADNYNSKCDSYYDEGLNALECDWSKGHTSAFMNPPYGRRIGEFVKKAYDESQKGCTVVCLLPSRTDTKWWHDYCMKGEVRFIKGRLKFSNSNNSAPFPSAIVIFKPNRD